MEKYKQFFVAGVFVLAAACDQMPTEQSQDSVYSVEDRAGDMEDDLVAEQASPLQDACSAVCDGGNNARFSSDVLTGGGPSSWDGSAEALAIRARSARWQLTATNAATPDETEFGLEYWQSDSSSTGAKQILRIQRENQLGPNAQFTFYGTMRADEIIVEDVSGADFVFDKDYELLPLDKVEAFIREHRHLPDVPSASASEREGISIGEYQTLLLRKIEEITLHTIEQDKQIEALNAELRDLKKSSGQKE